MTDKQWFIEQFDAFVTENGDGIELDKSRHAVAYAYADGVESGELNRWADDLIDEGRSLFDRLVKPAREHRKSSMRKSAEYLIDCLVGDTVLGSDDPTLNQAFPMGDGRDKTLRHWTRDDWRAAATERYRNAAAVTNAAHSFDQVADEIAAALVRRGVNTTGALFAGVEA